MRLSDYLSSMTEPAESAPVQHELVVDKGTGEVRQAGADRSGKWVASFRTAAERSLYVFAVGVMGRTYLNKTLHEPLCNWLTAKPKDRRTDQPVRKLALVPREHAKTTIASHALPPHILIQPSDSNIYFPGEAGSEQRILLCGETELRAVDNLRVIETAYENNELLRALWPHLMWDEPRRQSKKWNDREMIVRRATEYPEPSIRAVGVGGAITGMHPTVLIKDDLISFEAANSLTVMHTAVQWHIASRALINSPSSLEFIVGTRWAAWDLYRYVTENDPSVEVYLRAAIEEGAVIYPERFTLEQFDRLRKEFGPLYPLLYMNTAVDASLTDFDMKDVRTYEITDGKFVFTEDERDLILADREDVSFPDTARPGLPINSETHDLIFGRAEYFRMKYGV